MGGYVGALSCMRIGLGDMDSLYVNCVGVKMSFRQVALTALPSSIILVFSRVKKPV